MKRFISPIAITIYLILSLVIILCIYVYTCFNKPLEIISSIYGGFVATLIGVYWSIHLTKQHEFEKEEERREKNLIASLKLIFSELDVSIMNFETLKEAIDQAPEDVPTLFDTYNFLLKIISVVKDEAFYAIIASGNMGEITRQDKIFNSTQQAYYNMHLTIGRLNTSREIFKEHDRKLRIPIEETQNCLVIFHKDKKKVMSCIRLLESARNEIRAYLEMKGAKFSVDQRVINT